MWIASRNWWSLASSVFLLLELSFVAGVRGDAPAGCGVCQGCLYGVDGICIPRRISYGFYETRWRRWPAEQRDRLRESVDSSAGLDDVPTGEVPQATEEGDALPSLPGRPIHRSDSRETSPSTDRRDTYQRDLIEDPFRDDPVSPTDTTQARRANSEVSRASYAPPANDVQNVEIPSRLLNPGLLSLASSAPQTASDNTTRRQIVRQVTALRRAVRPGGTGRQRFNPLRFGEAIPPTIEAPSIEDSADANHYVAPAFDPSVMSYTGSANRRNPLRQ